jgi:hypothetical protein
VPESLNKVESLPVIWSMHGNPHNGMDCFVFPREAYECFEIGDICMGTPWSETTLMASMIHWDYNFVVIRNCGVTYHVGDRRTWLADNLKDYRQHNIKEFCKCIRKLSEDFDGEFLEHEELQVFGWKLQRESEIYKWRDVPEIKYWLDKGYGENVPDKILDRLVGYNK